MALKIKKKDRYKRQIRLSKLFGFNVLQRCMPPNERKRRYAKNNRHKIKLHEPEQHRALILSKEVYKSPKGRPVVLGYTFVGVDREFSDDNDND